MSNESNKKQLSRKKISRLQTAQLSKSNKEQLSPKAKRINAFVNIVWKVYLNTFVVFLMTILLNLLVKTDWLENFTKAACIWYSVAWGFCVLITFFTGRYGKWYLPLGCRSYTDYHSRKGQKLP